MSGLFAEDDFADNDSFDIESEAGDIADREAAAKGAEANPRLTADLFGHEAVENALLADFNAGRMPHAIILAGAPGVGKATLAFRLARFLLSQGGEDSGDSLFGAPEKPKTLNVKADHDIFRRVVSGGHGDLLVIEREFDDKKGKMKKDISAEQARSIAPFLRKTASEGGWRVVIVDGAEDVNTASQNALLKILEEPPQKSLLILTTSQPAAFLPTIRSRCRLLSLERLSDDVMYKLLDIYAPGLMPEQKTALMRLSEGSIGKALQLQQDNGLQIYRDMIKLLAAVPEIDPLQINDFAEKYGKFGAEAQADVFFDLLGCALRRLMTALVRETALVDAVDGDSAALQRLVRLYTLPQLTTLYERLLQLQQQAERANLDRRQMITFAFLMIQRPDYQGPLLTP